MEKNAKIYGGKQRFRISPADGATVTQIYLKKIGVDPDEILDIRYPDEILPKKSSKIRINLDHFSPFGKVVGSLISYKNLTLQYISARAISPASEILKRCLSPHGKEFCLDFSNPN